MEINLGNSKKVDPLRISIPLLLLVLSNLLILSGCTNLVSTESGPPSSQEILPSADESGAPVLPSQTLSPMPSSTATVTGTSYVPPTVMMGRFYELLLPSDDCMLPCMFDIRPGVTTRDEVISIFSEFDPDIKYSESDDLAYGDINAEMPIYAREAAHWGDLHVEIWLDEDVVEIVRFWFILEMPPIPSFPFSISNVLQHYGVPDEISISSNSSPNPSGFSTTLWYLSQGFDAHYYTQDDMVISSNEVVGCLPEFPLVIDIWDTDIYSTIDEIGEATGISQGLQLDKPIDEVSEYSEGSFYETFRYITRVCIPTTRSAWPSE